MQMLTCKSNKAITMPERSVNVIGSYDTVVIGGGCAGFAAALACARCGAKTIVIERFPFFGGTATASLMANMVGFRNQGLPDDLQVCKGISEELMLDLLKTGDAAVTRNAYKTSDTIHTGTKGDLCYSYVFNTEKFKQLTLKKAVSAGVDILFHTWFIDLLYADQAEKYVVFAGKSGIEAVSAKIVIDATGDADAAVKAGAKFIRYNEGKKLSDCLMLKIRGFDKNNIDINSCVLGDDMIVWGPTVDGYNCADTLQLSAAEIQARLNVDDYFSQIKEKSSTLKNADIADSGCLIGIRQTRFIQGDYTISVEDVIEGKVPADTIAMGVNPIISYYGYRKYLNHPGYGISFGCLLPKGIDGMFVAGRCISSDQAAFESWRCMPTIISLGEAAGTAAALCVKQNMNPRELNIQQLREQLIKNGAEVGQNLKV